MSGLLAAAVLGREGAQVTLIDRDFLGVSGPRRGVGQADHLHVLLQRGRLIFEELFPGLDQELEQAGAPELDWGADTLWYSRRGVFPRVKTGVATRSCSRTLLEDRIRARVLRMSSVRVIERAEVSGLEFRTPREIRQVVLKEGQTLRADFYIDASGRTSRLIPGRVFESLDASVGYTSCLMKIPDEALPGFRQLYVQMRPPRLLRAGVLAPQEGGVHRVTLIGAAGVHAPSEEEGFRSFARDLADPVFSEVISRGKVVSPIRSYRRTQAYRVVARRSTLPGNGLVFGDAQCALNPVYGHGMTVSALAASLLGPMVRQGRLDSEHFQKQVGRLLYTPWILSAGEDRRIPHLKQEGFGLMSGLAVRASQHLADRLIEKAVNDSRAHRRFLRILHLMEGPGL